MNFNHLKQNKKKLFLAAAVLWLLVCVFVTPVFTTVTLTFESDPHGEVVTTVFAGFRGEHNCPGRPSPGGGDSGVARVFYGDLQYGRHCSLKRIDPLDQHYSTGEPLTITGLTVKKNGIQTVALTGDELRTYFTVNGRSGADRRGRLYLPCDRRGFPDASDWTHSKHCTPGRPLRRGFWAGLEAVSCWYWLFFWCAWFVRAMRRNKVSFLN